MNWWEMINELNYLAARWILIIAQLSGRLNNNNNKIDNDVSPLISTLAEKGSFLSLPSLSSICCLADLAAMEM